MIYGFLDESASLNDNSYFFCVGVFFSEHEIERELGLILKRTREKLFKQKKKSVSEIKFNNSSDKLRKLILTRINKLNIKIVATIIDKEKRKITDNVNNYSLAIIQTLKSISPKTRTHLVLDKRYTNRSQNTDVLLRLENRASKFLTLTFGDSQTSPGLQVADFIVGAVNYKYNHKNSAYLDIIKQKIVCEEITTWSEIKKEDIRSLGPDSHRE